MLLLIVMTVMIYPKGPYNIYYYYGMRPPKALIRMVFWDLVAQW